MCGASVLLTLGLAFCTMQCAQAQGFNIHPDPFGEGYAQGAWNIEHSGDGWLVYSSSYEPDTISPDSVVGAYVILLFRIDHNGQVQWARKHKLHGSSISLGWANCCDSVDGGGGISAGSIIDPTGTFRIRLMKYDHDGDTLWTRIFYDNVQDLSGNSVRQTGDGGFLITGFDYYDGNLHGLLIKTDSAGHEEWRTSYGAGDTQSAILSSAILTSGYIVGGYTFTESDNTKLWVQRITGDGVVIWVKTWGPDSYNAPAYVELISDSTILVASSWGYSPDGSSMAYYLAKLDLAAGILIWEHQYGGIGYGQFLAVAKECPNSDLIACGLSYEGGHEQGLLLRTSAGGDSLWMRRYWYYDTIVAQGQGRFWDVLPTSDGGCIATGYSGAPFEPPIPPGISQDAWVVKVDSMGCIVPGCDGVGITEQITNLGDALQLWPNPVSGELHVGIHIPANFKSTGPLTLSSTTLEGKLVLQRQVPSSMPDELVLDVSSLAPGVYSLHLSDATRWLAGQKFVVQ